MTMPAFRSETHGRAVSSPFTVAMPAGAIAGDLLIFHARNVAMSSRVTPPDGDTGAWKFPAGTTDIPALTTHSYLFARWCPSSPPASFIFTGIFGTAVQWCLSAWSDVDAVPFRFDHEFNLASFLSSNFDAMADARSLSVFFLSAAQTAGVFTDDGDYTNRYDQNSIDSHLRCSDAARTGSSPIAISPTFAVSPVISANAEIRHLSLRERVNTPPLYSKYSGPEERPDLTMQFDPEYQFSLWMPVNSVGKSKIDRITDPTVVSGTAIERAGGGGISVA